MSLTPVTHELKRGGGIVVLRVVGSSEKDRVKTFFESLDDETIYMRFLHPVKDFTRYVETIFGPLNKYGVIVVAETVSTKNIVGVGELLAKNTLVGEIAVTVHPNYRRQGVGTKLTAYLAYAAYTRGVERLEAYISSDNIAARKIAEKLNLKLQYVGMGVYRVLVDVRSVIDKALTLLGLHGVKG